MKQCMEPLARWFHESFSWPEIEVNFHLLLPITVIWQPPDFKIKAMNAAIIYLADEGMIYEKYISTLLNIYFWFK